MLHVEGPGPGFVRLRPNQATYYFEIMKTVMEVATDLARSHREEDPATQDIYLAPAHAALNADPSVLAMLLQMVFEKLAKAALLRAGAIDIHFATSSHAAASRMVQAMKLQRGIIAPLGGPRSWDDVLWLIESLERAHPALAGQTPALRSSSTRGRRPKEP